MSFGPTLKLGVALLLLAAFALLAIFVIVPFVSARLSGGDSLFGETPTAETAKETAPPINPMLLNQVKTVQYGAGYGLPTAVVDPSVYEGEILFATGASENTCDRLVRLNPETGVFANVELKRLNDTIRYPVENADVILYADCKTGG